MTMSPGTGPASYISDAIAAKSSPKGTVLPRSGVFWGVRAPQYHSTIVVGEFADSGASGTQVRGWLEPHEHLADQTGFAHLQTGRLRAANFGIDLDAIFTGVHGDLTSTQLVTGSYSQAKAPHYIRDIDVACALDRKSV